MTHPKMEYTYVGIDSHKDTHTAVFINCFFEKLGEISFSNLPSKFPEFLKNALEVKAPGTELLFGLEDISMYGRTFAVFCKDNNLQAKHVNAFLVAQERKNQNISEKTDAVDAECAARVLLSKFGELPDANPDDRYWALQSLVMRRKSMVKGNVALKNHLHSLLTQHYPNYREWFPNIDSMASLAFFMRFPSPSTLKGITHEELSEFLIDASNCRVGAGKNATVKAQDILGTLQDTTVQFQELRDGIVQSTIRQINSSLEEIAHIESTIARFMENFECTLTSMTGIDIISAAQLLACIGDIKRFSTPAKLARYSGVAPVTYASGKKDMHFANKRGDRELNSILYLLSVRLITAPANRMLNPFFYEYYHRKLSEGKTKRQALKCVQRRLVNIIWTMLTNNEDYVNPPMFEPTQKNVE